MESAEQLDVTVEEFRLGQVRRKPRIRSRSGSSQQQRAPAAAPTHRRHAGLSFEGRADAGLAPREQFLRGLSLDALTPTSRWPFLA